LTFRRSQDQEILLSGPEKKDHALLPRPSSHSSVYLPTQRSPSLNRSPQHIPRRQMAHSIRRLDHRRLCSLSGARRPHDDHAEGRGSGPEGLFGVGEEGVHLNWTERVSETVTCDSGDDSVHRPANKLLLVLLTAISSPFQPAGPCVQLQPGSAFCRLPRSNAPETRPAAIVAPTSASRVD
jgi:hypothetical protein